jgi:outer membrane murein-binding lipoprotein Lpp
LAGVTLLAGCGALHQGAGFSSNVHEELKAALAQTRQEVLAGRFGVADRFLNDFAARYPATAEAFEVNYYRALFKLEPANQTATVRDAEALLDTYLAASGPLPHRAEATTLRHIATLLARWPAVAAGAGGSTPASAKADEKTRDEEIQRLKDELGKANAELERIKKRLSQPKP